MDHRVQPIFIGETVHKASERAAVGEYITLLGEVFYKIQNFDAIEPFFMSVVSSSDHWLFVSSTGGISAGRVSPEQSLFPYYTVDKITENYENTGNKAILLVKRLAKISLWEPFSDRQSGNYTIERNILKNIASTTVMFEEINIDLGLIYRYTWRTSEKYGFVKTTWLINTQDTMCQVELVDGIQNILPANVAMSTQNLFSSLLDAYKRSELHSETGLATFSLSSCLTDLAEPSESLLATTVCQLGLEHTKTLLSSVQLNNFRRGADVEIETEVRGRRGAYLSHAALDLAPRADRSWYLLADVHQDHTAVFRKIEELEGDHEILCHEIEADIISGQAILWGIVAGADGLQLSNDRNCTTHHYANVMFNLMRGGTFLDQYWIHKNDFEMFVMKHNQPLLLEQADFFASLPTNLHICDLQSRAEANGTSDLIRLSYAFLPLVISRRHGDPSRPWNRFAINLKNPDSSLKLGYEGNWRDIFQNWEALAYSYPEYIEGMISTFLNATTVDGYNPYRITYQGVDWEIPEPGNPWANIGYWSDHQVIYLQKLIEVSEKQHPGRLRYFLDKQIFSYACVPYRILPYADLLKDPYNTIEFAWELEREIEGKLGEIGSDAKLVSRPDGQVLHVSLAEKLLTLMLAKLANFVPEGGIWMNTQRPEWNDANNALVGKGLSVVTLCYLRRMIVFCRELFGGSAPGVVPVSKEVQRFFTQVTETLQAFQSILTGPINDEQRRSVMDALGQAGSDYRWKYYQHGLSGEFAWLQVEDILAFLDLVQRYLEHSLRANKRKDALFHAYNILHLDKQGATISHLYEMLEGQEAILSSGMLSGEESLALLNNIRDSPLYEADQHSYILYPDRKLSGFLDKNSLTQEQVQDITLFDALVQAGDDTLITRDLKAVYHFSGTIHNIHDVNRALDALQHDPKFSALVEEQSGKIRELFEETFHHDQFTGRSGTFFAYEGLGSIYWHMVSKLLLAVQETALHYRDEPTGKALSEKYADIRQGLGFNKSPSSFGAFPTDPYSHTPKSQGAKQPGMTGCVKEEILARQAELGLIIQNGQLSFDRFLLDPREYLLTPGTFSWLDVNGCWQELDLPARSLGYTICQVLVILQAAGEDCIKVSFSNGSEQIIPGLELDITNSRHIFQRNGKVHHLEVTFSETE